MLLSESLGVSSAQLRKFGVFDSYLGIDSLLHVDQARLRSTRIPELLGSHKRFQHYSARILGLIVNDATEKLSASRLKGFFDYDADAAEQDT